MIIFTSYIVFLRYTRIFTLLNRKKDSSSVAVDSVRTHYILRSRKILGKTI